MKKNTLFTILIAGGMIACNDPKGTVENDTLAEATEDSAVVYDDQRGRMEVDGLEIEQVGEDFWEDVNWEAPVVADPELEAADIEKRATTDYTIYMLDEQPLFDTDKAKIRPEGEEKLQQVVDEIKALPNGGQIRVFGHTDARASKEYNEELSAERAQSVQNWLKEKGGLSGERISTEAMGETAPRATNETERGRQLNRRVAIVVVTRQ